MIISLLFIPHNAEPQELITGQKCGESQLTLVFMGFEFVIYFLLNCPPGTFQKPNFVFFQNGWWDILISVSNAGPLDPNLWEVGNWHFCSRTNREHAKTQFWTARALGNSLELPERSGNSLELHEHSGNSLELPKHLGNWFNQPERFYMYMLVFHWTYLKIKVIWRSRSFEGQVKYK